jgi:hypothetical protein
MNKEFKKLWIEALRSGEYQQGTSALNANGKFCCLGVLCEVFIKQHPGAIDVVERDGKTRYGASCVYLPFEVMQAAQLSVKSPQVEYFGIYRTLAELNDNEMPFSKIADLIGEQL